MCPRLASSGLVRVSSLRRFLDDIEDELIIRVGDDGYLAHRFTPDLRTKRITLNEHEPRLELVERNRRS